MSIQTHASTCDSIKHSNDEFFSLQKAEINNNRFCLILEKTNGNLGESYKVNKIVITDLKNKVIQQIQPKDNDYISMQPDELLQKGDFNFDGKNDFFIYSNDGGISPNNTNIFFIYDKRSKIYKENKFLSDLPQPVINAKNKYIESSSRDGCCSYSLERYKVVNDKYMKFYTKDESLTSNGKYIQITIGTLVNGKFKYKSTRIKAPKE